MFPRQPKLFIDAYKTATTQPYGYLFLGFRSTTPYELQKRTFVLGNCEDRFTRIFKNEKGIMDVFTLVPQSNHDNYGLLKPIKSHPKINNVASVKKLHRMRCEKKEEPRRGAKSGKVQ